MKPHAWKITEMDGGIDHYDSYDCTECGVTGCLLANDPRTWPIYTKSFIGTTMPMDCDEAKAQIAKAIALQKEEDQKRIAEEAAIAWKRSLLTPSQLAFDNMQGTMSSWLYHDIPPEEIVDFLEQALEAFKGGLTIREVSDKLLELYKEQNT